MPLSPAGRTRLRLLLLEDDLPDAELLLRELKKANFDVTCTRVDNQKDYTEQLAGNFDLIIADYNMPAFTGLRALELVRSRGISIPFIIVSGMIGEDEAVEAIHLGATDYLLKDRLTRLGEAVRYALRVRKLNEEKAVTNSALLVSESRFRAFFELNLIGMFVTSGTKQITELNDKVCDIFGYSREELMSLNRLALMHPDDIAQEEKLFRQMVKGDIESYVIDKRYFRKDGRLIFTNVSMTCTRLPDGSIDSLFGLVEDMTERKLAEEKLKETELRFRQLAENISQVFYLVDPGTTQMFYVSPAYETIWGRSCESLYANPRSWGEAVHPDDVERVMSVVAPHGTLVTSDTEYRILRPDGGERFVRARAFPVAAANGEIYRYAGLAEDITEKKSVERRLAQAQKMEAVGQLSGGIAHDFNNLLTVILGNISLLELMQLTAKAQDMVAEVKNAAESAAQLTRQLLLFSRKEIPEMHRIDINLSITATSKLLMRILGEHIELNFQPSLEPLFVQGNGVMLDQLLMNLAVNARDAMPSGGTLTIATQLVVLDATSAALDPRARPGKFTLLSVTDSGSGIPADLLPKIFEPFFTTKDVGKGTGIGLASVLGIVQQHGGWLSVYSKTKDSAQTTASSGTLSKNAPDHGTTFRVYLPFQNLAPQSVKKTPQSATARRGTETILLVEDEAAIRSLVTTFLGSLGYTVLAAANGPEALELFKAQGENISLVLTDMIMPGGMTGFDLGVALLKNRADIRIIYSSGYNEIPKPAGLEVHKDVNFLGKPFTLTALENIIRYQLDLPAIATGKLPL